MAVRKSLTGQLDDDLRRLVHSRRRKRRLGAVERLRALPAPQAIPVLVQLLRDRAACVGDAAAGALRDDFGAAGRDAMQRALDGDSQWARLAVQCSLAVARNPELAALDGVLKDPDLDEWGFAIERLVSIGVEARPLIERRLMDRKGAQMLREMCSSAFVELVGEDARPLLVQVARTTRSSTVKAAACRDLWELDRARRQERAET